MSEYVDFWRGQAKHDIHIVPDGFEQPQGAEKTAELLKPHVIGAVLDFGCGHGRLARHFEDYIGYDLSPACVAAASAAHPDKWFMVRDIGEEMIEADTAIAFTVMLHIPDGLIKQEIDAVKKSCKRLIIAEMMGKEWRKGQKTYVYNRDIEEYAEMVGWPYTVHQVTNLRYNAPFTYMVFDCP